MINIEFIFAATSNQSDRAFIRECEWPHLPAMETKMTLFPGGEAVAIREVKALVDGSRAQIRLASFSHISDDDLESLTASLQAFDWKLVSEKPGNMVPAGVILP